jgi:hypothetical protein
MLDFPDPFSPVIALKLSSLGFVSGVFPTEGCKQNTYQPEMTVRTAYDL